MSYNYKSYYTNKNPLSQSQLAKMEKPKKNPIKQKKTSPKFEICSSVRLFCVETPQTLNVLDYGD